MKLTVALSTLLYTTDSAASVFGQAPLKQDYEATNFDLVYELKKAEIIPTVIDSFKPFLTVNISWQNASTEYGNTISPDKTQKTPNIALYDFRPDFFSPSSKTPQLTLAMTDPDAPSRDNPEWSEICHWIATEIPLSKSSSGLVEGESRYFKEIMPYKPPGPPPTTGKHRYVFVALASLNGTTEKLHLKKPSDRQHWGYEKERQGLRMWAEEMGLGVVGVNFIYEQNDRQ